MERSAAHLGSPPAARLPSGTVTFLFSDIEGSSQRWERSGPAMQEALRRHDAILRAAIEAEGGYVFKTIGDAFCATFTNAPDAVAAALSAQRGLHAEDWSAVDGLKVRVAIHTGQADERDGDYFGAAVNRVARMLAVAHGDQVLVSGIATDLSQGRLPAQVSLHDLGQHRLRDLALPEQIYQLVAPELPREFPPLRSLEVLPHNLPLQVTGFVGREKDVAEIKALLGKTRLLTLVGTGGVGKTRCALQVGADLLDGSGDGVWFVELAPLGDGGLVPGAIAAALGVTESSKSPVLETLTAYLKNKRALLILDNCEHVVREAAQSADAIIRNCPQITILATSREGLGIAGETTHRMPSLTIPESTRGLRAEDAMQFGSVALFADRAAAADTSFALTDANAGTVAEICRRLDGIALALELAAARVKLLSVEQLAKMLDERFRVLTGGSRTGLPRQQTMRALVDWSYDLLSELEKRIFRRLAIFAGGWTLEAAQTVCSDEEIAEFDVLDLLSALVDKSLVAVELVDSARRYRLLESMRQYALEKLGSERPAVAARHAGWALAFAEDAEARWNRTPTRAWRATVAPEMDNMRAAVTWALGSATGTRTGQRIVAALLRAWQDFGAAEGRRWVRESLALCDDATDPELIARLELTETGVNLNLADLIGAQRSAESALARYTELNDELGVAQCRLAMGSILAYASDTRSISLLSEALATFRARGLTKLAGSTHRAMGLAHFFAGDLQAGRRELDEALSIAQSTGDELSLGLIASNLAEVEFSAGNVETALRYSAESMAMHRGRDSMLCTDLGNRAAYFLTLGRYDESRHAAKESLRIANDAQVGATIAFTTQHLAALDALTGDHKRAARLLGYSDRRIATFQSHEREPTEQRTYDMALEALRKEFDDAELTRLMDEGRLWDDERAIAEASQV